MLTVGTRVRGRALRFYQRGKLPPSLRETLQKVPYIDPNMEEDHIRKVAELDTAIRIAAVQIGVFYVDPAARARAFSVEWEYDSIGGDPTWLGMHYDHRVIRIKVLRTIISAVVCSYSVQFMDPIDSVAQRTLVVKLSSIQGMESGMETGKPCKSSYQCLVVGVTYSHALIDIIFDLHTPVIIETEDPYRTLSGDRQRDSKDFRHRLTSFDSDHALVAPYAHHLRIVLFNEDDLDEFDRFCDVVTIRRPVRPSLPTEASQRRFFSAMRLREVQCWIALVDWPVAFQIEALLHNGLVTTEVLLAQLRQPIMQAYDDDRTKCADLLRYFVEGLQAPARPPDESALECFLRVQQGKRAQVLTSMPPGIFSCRRVTFTPTRMLLEGP
jgi:RNA-dependent RNA polymerase